MSKFSLLETSTSLFLYELGVLLCKLLYISLSLPGFIMVVGLRKEVRRMFFSKSKYVQLIQKYPQNTICERVDGVAC